MMKKGLKILLGFLGVIITLCYIYMGTWRNGQSLSWSFKINDFLGLEIEPGVYDSISGLYLFDDDFMWIKPLFGLISVITLGILLSKVLKVTLKVNSPLVPYLGLLPLLYFPFKTLLFFGTIRARALWHAFLGDWLPEFLWHTPFLFEAEISIYPLAILGLIFYLSLKKHSSKEIH